MFVSSHELMHPFGMLRPTSVVHRWKPNVEIAPNCPRCDSANTKFCYYNNYSLTQPRYFCKACRRYWTKGGSLRNVPVGGGCRKNRRRRHGKSTRRITTTENYTPTTLRPDLALYHTVGSSHQPSMPDDDQSSSSRDASTIDLAALYSKFLNHCPETTQQELHGHGQFVQELADGAGGAYELIGPDGLGGGSEAPLGELSNYDPFDVASSLQYGSSLGMTASISAGEAFTPGLSSCQAPELQAGLCPFPGMGCDWSSLDQSSFGAF